MTIGAIVFVRFDSSRLPGKALKLIGERPLLGHVFSRIRRIKPDIPILLATSERPCDDAVVNFAANENVRVFRGSLNNVAQRAVDCARKYGLSGFLRVCGDRPFHDPDLARRLIEMYTGNNLDLATNALVPTYPAGLTSEVVRTSALERVLEQTTNRDDLEHLSSYFYRHREKFRIGDIRADDTSLAGLHLAVDTADDLLRARWIADRLDDPVSAPLELIVSLARQWDDCEGKKRTPAYR